MIGTGSYTTSTNRHVSLNISRTPQGRIVENAQLRPNVFGGIDVVRGKGGDGKTQPFFKFRQPFPFEGAIDFQVEASKNRFEERKKKAPKQKNIIRSVCMYV